MRFSLKMFLIEVNTFSVWWNKVHISTILSNNLSLFLYLAKYLIIIFRFKNILDFLKICIFSFSGKNEMNKCHELFTY